jgi:ubiquinone/menaquinone biosynthesis C-methylase UbiE
MIQKLIRLIKYKLGIPTMYQSETSKVRHLVLTYCVGKGCDIGFGGDKVKKTDCDGIDYATPYAYTGKDKVDIACDVMNEPIPVADSTYDYVYTSHLIEDFVDTNAALIEFIRILKSGGNLILVFPDQVVYHAHCIKTNQPLNPHHVHKDMGSAFMLRCMDSLVGITYQTILKSDLEIDYNVVLILKIEKLNEKTN